MYMRAATVWEIAITVALGKLVDRDGAVPRLPSILVERGMVSLLILPTHAVEAARLPLIHRIRLIACWSRRVASNSSRS